MRAAAVAALVGAVFVLSGCQYLLGLGGMPPVTPPDFGSFDPGDPMFSPPPPLATYTTGSATVSIGGAVAKLDRLAGGALYQGGLGAEVDWTDGKGLYLRFFGTPEAQSPTGAGFVTLDRIADGQHWTTPDPSLCTVKVTQAGTKGIAGTATCTGLRWIDTMAPYIGVQPAYVEGEAPFDAEITFGAVP